MAAMLPNRGGVASSSASSLQLARPPGRQFARRRTVVRVTGEASGPPRAATHLWRQYYRYRRYTEAKQAGLPPVSWDRYHCSIIFVDRSDTVRARVAAGLFDRIAHWNGFGRALYATTAGVEASGQPADITTSAGLMAQAGLLKIPPKLFSRPGEPFEVEDLDRNELVVAADVPTRERLRAMLCEGVPDCTQTMSTVALLSDFSGYLGPPSLLRTGGSAVLEPELRAILAPCLAEARAAPEIASPSLTGGAGEWNAMVRATICGCAGLVQYLIDAWPPDLPDYDPL